MKLVKFTKHKLPLDPTEFIYINPEYVVTVRTIKPAWDSNSLVEITTTKDVHHVAESLDQTVSNLDLDNIIIRV